MAHRVATDEICVKRGMGKSPSSRRRGLIRVPACCLLAPKDLACRFLRPFVPSRPPEKYFPKTFKNFATNADKIVLIG